RRSRPPPPHRSVPETPRTILRRSGAVEVGLDDDVDAALFRSARGGLVVGDRRRLAVAGGYQPVARYAHRVDHVLLHGFGAALRQALVHLVAAVGIRVALDDQLRAGEHVDGPLDFREQVERLLLDLGLAAVEREPDQAKDDVVTLAQHARFLAR